MNDVCMKVHPKVDVRAVMTYIAQYMDLDDIHQCKFNKKEKKDKKKEIKKRKDRGLNDQSISKFKFKRHSRTSGSTARR